MIVRPHNTMIVTHHGTTTCGADRKRMTVVSIVYKVSPRRQNLSITMAANFQSEITSSSPSLSLSLLVIYLNSFSICFTSLEMSCATFLLEEQQQWWSWLEHPPPLKGSSSGCEGKERAYPPPDRDIGLNVPLRAPFSIPWSFWWRGELGVEQHLEIFAAILFSIMMDLMVIFLVGLLYLSSHGSHCRKTRLLHVGISCVSGVL